MNASPKLVVLCQRPYDPRLGPMGWNSSWQGELAVQLHDLTVVKIGATVYDQSTADYSSNYRNWYQAQLHKTERGWLLKLIGLAFEMGVGDSITSTQRWLSDDDGKGWSKVEEGAVLVEGLLVDEMETPASDRTIYV